MSFKTYAASQEVVSKARSLGVLGDTEARLKRMARRSAPFTSDVGNRRFMNYVLLIEGGTIKDVTYMEPEQ